MPNTPNLQNRGAELMGSLSQPNTITNNKVDISNRGASLMGFTSPSVITPEVTNTSNPTIQQDFGQKVISFAKNVIAQVQKKGLGGAIADAIIPPAMQQPEEVKQQNAKAFVESATNKGAEIVATVGANLIDEATKQFASTGSAYVGLLNKDLLTPEDKTLLKDKGYLDNNGNIKLGKTVAETAKNVFTLSIFFPELTIPAKLISKAATGENVINVLGKAIPVSKIMSGGIINGTFFAVYTPNLEKIFTDPNVAGEFVKNFFVGAGIGEILTIPAELIKLPENNVVSNLSLAEKEELRLLKYDLAKQYHPNSMLPTASNKTWQTIQGKIEQGDLNWLRKLKNASPEEAGKMLGSAIKEASNLGKQLPEKAGNQIDQAMQSEGWANDAQKAKFDQALLLKDKATVEQMLPEVPQYYKDKFSKEITDVTGEVASKVLETNKNYQLQQFKENPVVAHLPYVEGNPFVKLTPEQAIKLKDEVSAIETPTKENVKQMLHISQADRFEGKIPVTVEELASKSTIAKNAFEKAGILKAEAKPVVSKPTEVKLEKPVTKPMEIKPKVVSVPREQLPVGTGEKTVSSKTVEVPKEQLPIGEGKLKVSRLEARMKGLLKDMSEDDIKSLGLATYKQMNMETYLKKAAEFVTSDPEKAVRVLSGQEPMPEGLNPGLIYHALTNVENLPLDLATRVSSLLSTAMGQSISALRGINKNNSITLMGDLIKVRVADVENRYGKPIKEVVKSEVKKLKKQIKPISRSKWLEFLDEIEC